MVWADGTARYLAVLAVARANPQRQVYSVQDWWVDVATPVDADPEDSESIEGAVTVRVVHQLFGDQFFAEALQGLALYDDALPQVCECVSVLSV